MNRIARKEVLVKDDTVLMEIKSPKVAKNMQAGNFVMLRVSEKGEKIPMSIFDFDRKKGTVTIAFKIVGKTTRDLSRLDVGDSLLNFVGPLGNPSKIGRFGTVVCIGGGIGCAPINAIAREFKRVGNEVITILGFRSKEYVILEKEIKRYSNEMYVTTDDGSYGEKGFVSDVLKRLMNERKIDWVFAVGPIIMMKVVSEITKPKKITTIVSLNPIMVDGTGMCGCCRVTVGKETRFGCVDGPDFDGHLVDFDNLTLRNRRFLEEEKKAVLRQGDRCGCEKG